MTATSFAVGGGEMSVGPYLSVKKKIPLKLKATKTKSIKTFKVDSNWFDLEILKLRKEENVGWPMLHYII